MLIVVCDSSGDGGGCLVLKASQLGHSYLSDFPPNQMHFKIQRTKYRGVSG